MYRIRFHGRGGQGMKTASRILGTAFFLAGFEVQDAPRYGAERRGAPIFAYVRADRSSINERGIINRPSLVVVSDDTLIGMTAAGVMQGIDRHSVLLINSHEEAATWQHRLNTEARIIILSAREDIEDRAELPYISSRCAAAAAALTGVVPRDEFMRALNQELEQLGREVVMQNQSVALQVFDDMVRLAGSVIEGGSLPAADYIHPDWISLPFENAEISALAIHSAANSIEVRTGLWRTMRPIIDYEKCSGCWWLCSTYCPDGAIKVKDDGYPDIDYEHCKGCLVCLVQCPPNAIYSIPEHVASQRDREAATS